MRLIRCLSDFHGTPHGVALAIGNFDGFHLGHKAVIERMLEKSRNLGLTPAVMIFEPQPLEFFSQDKSPARIYSLRDKLQALEVAGVKIVFCMRFNEQFASMDAKEYVLGLLHRDLGVKSVTVGSLFSFGKGGKSTIDDLKKIGETVGMEASAIEGVMQDGERLSSTRIREFLMKGQLGLAKKALGRYYSMSGIVVHGNQIGRTLGFPTANVNINRRISPLRGVYAVKVLCDHGLYNGMANVGCRPTVVKGQTKAILEVNIFDFKHDIYGEAIRVYFIEKIRDEQKFSSLDELKSRLEQDKINCLNCLVRYTNQDF
ncbi:MAG: bifunctional riboflavin kinase/FAD synthetase [Succinivibrio sp.]